MRELSAQLTEGETYDSQIGLFAYSFSPSVKNQRFLPPPSSEGGFGAVRTLRDCLPRSFRGSFFESNRLFPVMMTGAGPILQVRRENPAKSVFCPGIVSFSGKMLPVPAAHVKLHNLFWAPFFDFIPIQQSFVENAPLSIIPIYIAP